jgi:dihydrodipicolinate synthase/N-acetylneuraminate lyase
MTNESTEPDQTRLSDKQHLAIDALLTGGTHREAAKAAGVARTTVTEWVNHRSEFCRELERRRWERAEQVNDRVGALTTRSLDVVEEHLGAGDLRAALGVLRLLPREALHRAPTPPPTAEQREDVGAMFRARLAQLEALTDPSTSRTTNEVG